MSIFRHGIRVVATVFVGIVVVSCGLSDNKNDAVGLSPPTAALTVAAPSPPTGVSPPSDDPIIETYEAPPPIPGSTPSPPAPRHEHCPSGVPRGSDSCYTYYDYEYGVDETGTRE